MQLGLHLTRFNWPEGNTAIGPRVREIARRAEAAGFACLSAMDHFFQMPFAGLDPEEPMLEGYSVLACAAAVTERMRLGTMVTGVTYRHPGVLVKTVTSLDVLSGGRAWLGIGAAWYEREHLGLGVPFPPLAERFERLEETLQIAKQFWSGEVGPYEGKHYHLTETLCSPMPLSRPHPPILVGGGGERKTLRLVARYADACNLFDGPDLPRKLEVLQEHCANVGRRYEEIQKTVTMSLSVTRDGTGDAANPREAIERFARLAELGVDQAMVMAQEPLELATIDIFGEQIVPEAQKLVPAGRSPVAA